MDYTLEQVNKLILNAHLASKINSIDIHQEDLTKSTDFETVYNLVKSFNTLQLNIYDTVELGIQRIAILTGYVNILNSIYYINYRLNNIQYSIRLMDNWETSNISRKFKYKQEPVGVIKIFAGTTIPANYLPCDGKAYHRLQYPQLYEVIGRSFNNSKDTLGNYLNTGNDLFRVPDLRRRFVIETDLRRDVSETRALDLDYVMKGLAGGSKKVMLSNKQSGMIEHTHNGSVTLGNSGKHRHKWFGDDEISTKVTDSRVGGLNLEVVSGYDAESDLEGDSRVYFTSKDEGHEHKGTIKINNKTLSYASQSHENRPPYYTLRYIIKAKY